MKTVSPDFFDSVPLVDSAAALERLDGEREIYSELIQTFLMQTDAHLEWMRLSTTPCDEAARVLFTHQVHHLKGAAMTVGAERLAARCAYIEQLLRSGDCDAARAELPGMPELYRISAEALKEAADNS